MGRPRKYANDAERARAYRERYAVLDVRVTREKAAKLDEIAAIRDQPRADLIAELISYALANRDWRTAPRFMAPVVSSPQQRRVSTKYQRVVADEGEDDA